LTSEIWTSGEWTGFYLERHHDRRGWMHLYLQFVLGESSTGLIRGEGTDYVGPWNLEGEFSRDENTASWAKRYVRKHVVRYEGVAGERGIIGKWSISGLMTGPFHIWPRAWGMLDEDYLVEELQGKGPANGRPGILGGDLGIMEPAFPDDNAKNSGF
jgi:hypothetical protein